jgi:hypothetical protein
MRKICLLLLAIVAGPAIATPTNMPRGSAVRKQVLDAVRPKYEGYLHQKVVLEVDKAKIEGNYAFVRVIPRQANGKPIDYSKTQYGEAYAHGAYSDGGEALVKRENGHWHVLAWEMGHTDVGYIDWPAKYGCSYALLGMPKP